MRLRSAYEGYRDRRRDGRKATARRVADGDVHVLNLATLVWWQKSNASLTEQQAHASIVVEKWLLIFGGESRPGTVAAMSVGETDTWMEHIAQEWGNKPFELWHMAAVQTGPAKMFTFGGADLTTKGPIMSSVEFVEGSASRTVSLVTGHGEAEPGESGRNRSAISKGKGTAMKTPPTSPRHHHPRGTPNKCRPLDRSPRFHGGPRST
jgi:hypothetical protein